MVEAGRLRSCGRTGCVSAGRRRVTGTSYDVVPVALTHAQRVTGRAHRYDGKRCRGLVAAGVLDDHRDVVGHVVQIALRGQLWADRQVAERGHRGRPPAIGPGLEDGRALVDLDDLLITGVDQRRG